MTSSSVIIMPQLLPVSLPNTENRATSPGSSTPGTPVTAPSVPASSDGDEASENGSEDSSISLISMPSSDEDEIWEDTRVNVASTPVERGPEHSTEQEREAEEFVVLYDDANSSEEE